MKRIVLISIWLVCCFLLAGPVRGEEFEIHWELEFEFADNTADDVNGGFQVDKFVIQPKYSIDDFLKVSAQFYFRSKGNPYLNEVHAKFINLPLDTWLDVGLYERAIKDHHSRLTETYSLYGNAFYRDDTYGISWGNWEKKFKAPQLYWIVSVTEGFEVGHVQPGELVPGAGGGDDKLIQDDLIDTEDLFYPEIGLNVGYNGEFGDVKADIMVFYYSDKLKANEKADLAGYLSLDQQSELDNDNLVSRAGLQGKIAIGDLGLFAGFISANDSGLTRTSYLVEASYKVRLEGDIFRSITPVLSYSGYTLTGDPDPAIAESWNRSQIILGAIVQMKEKSKLKLEYVINTEDTGNGSTKNNEIVLQLEVKF